MNLDARMQLIRHLATLMGGGEERVDARAGLVCLKFAEDGIEVTPATVRAFLAGLVAAEDRVYAGLAFGAVRLADYLDLADMETLQVPDTLEGLDP